MRSRLAEKGPPRGWLRLLLRLPIVLYRLRLGWLLGHRFLMLWHVGRSTGKVRRTVLEVVEYDPRARSAVVASGWGESAHWFRNVQANPDVVVEIGRERFGAKTSRLPESEAAGILLEYAQRHPLAFSEIARLMTGKPIEPEESACRRMAGIVPLVKFEAAMGVARDASGSADLRSERIRR